METYTTSNLKQEPFSVAHILEAIERVKVPVIHAKDTSLWIGKGMKVEESPYMPEDTAWIIHGGKLFATMKKIGDLWEARVYDEPLSLQYLPTPTNTNGE